MPAYIYLGEYTTYCFKAGNRSGLKLSDATEEELQKLYNSSLRKLNLAPIDTGLYGLSAKDFYTLRDAQQQIIACCAVYNQQSYKQYVISDYNRTYKLLSKLPVHLLGYPKFPAQNSSLNYASVAFLYVKNNDIRLGRQLLRAVAGQAGRDRQERRGEQAGACPDGKKGQFDVLLAGLFCNNPLRGIFGSIRHIKFQSRLYEVAWDDPQYIDSNPVGLEVSLL
jgi:hypothetical protein